jgi:SAM-dependent methyltransferase
MAPSHTLRITAKAMGLRRWLHRHLHPIQGHSVWQTAPVSRVWGSDRGAPIDRYYIEDFLGSWRRDIHGRVLEVKDSAYTQRFGTGVERADVLDIDPLNLQATIVADFSAADDIAAGQFDCIILTQTLQLIFDVPAAIGHVKRMLRPGGAVLVTVPAVSRLAHTYPTGADYWRFTPASCARLFGQVFDPQHVTVAAYGNVLTAMAFLTGLAQEELSQRELETRDEAYPVIVAVRAVKSTQEA